MNRKELIRRIASAMREKNIRKLVSSPKQVFHISDDEGNSKDFVIRKSERSVIFTNDDVEAVIDTCLDVIKEALRQGETIAISGFGALGLHYRKPRYTYHPETGERVDVAGRYLPRLNPYKELKMCGKLYELGITEEEEIEKLLTYDDDLDIEDGE